MRHKVTKTYDKYKNDRKNNEIEKLYRRQQKEYKKQKRKAKKDYENIENETVADGEAMARKIKNLTTSIQPRAQLINLEIPVLVRSLKSSNVELG